MSNVLFDNDETCPYPLNYLRRCSIENLNLLETLDPNDLLEWVDDDSDSGSQGSIKPDDLKEWLDVMSCEDEGTILKDLLNEDLQECLESSGNSEYSIYQTSTQADCAKKVPTIFDKSIDKSVIQQRIAAIQINLEATMFKTELSRQQILRKKCTTFSSNINPSVLSNLNDLVSGKRKCLTTNLEESRKCLKMFGPNNHIRKHGDFFPGKRSALTTEVEKSRNHLKILGGFKAQAPRARRADCGWLIKSKFNSALMA